LSHPQKPTDIGRNRTGLATSPKGAKETIEGAQPGRESLPGDGTHMLNVRVAYSRSAPPVGSMPPPASLKGLGKSVLDKLKGHEPMVFLDKLGERLAFERTGTRLYEALLAKLEAADTHDPSITPQVLLDIRDDELAHAGLVRQAIEELGGDPTVMTPCADITALASSGWVQVLSDPRSTFTQCLDVILLAELGDNAGWELLIELARGLGKDDLVDSFGAALLEEQRHLEIIRHWLATSIAGQAGADVVEEASPVV
jgi:rubrerythrin